MKNFQLWLCIFLAIVVGIALGDAGIVTKLGLRDPAPTEVVHTAKPTASAKATPKPTRTPSAEITALPLPDGWTRTSILWKDGDFYHLSKFCPMRYSPSQYGETVASLLEGTGAKPCPHCSGRDTSPTPRPTSNPNVDLSWRNESLRPPETTERAYLYVTDHGDKYHLGSCGSLWNSRNGPFTLSMVTEWGYEPCQRCDP